MVNTPVTLLNRIRDHANPGDWERFADLYYPLVLSWALRASGAYHDALDLTQSVFLKVHRHIQGFEHRGAGSLRAWLKQVLRNELNDLRTRRFPELVDFNEFFELQSIRRSGSPESGVYEQLFQEACALVRPEFSDHAWEMFDLTFIQGKDIDQVAADLGVTRNTLYVARARVSRRLKQVLEEKLL